MDGSGNSAFEQDTAIHVIGQEHWIVGRYPQGACHGSDFGHDLRAAIATADNQHSSRAVIVRARVVGRMDLLASEQFPPLNIGDIWVRPSAGCADYSPRDEGLLVRYNFQPLASRFHGFYPDRTLNREIVASFISTKIIKDVISRRITLMCGWRHQPSRQRAVSSGREQSQGIPAMAPSAAGAWLGIQDQEIYSSSTQIIAER